MFLNLALLLLVLAVSEGISSFFQVFLRDVGWGMEVYCCKRVHDLAGVRVLGAYLVLELCAVDVQLLTAGVEADERICTIVRVVVIMVVIITVIWFFYVGVRILMRVRMVMVSLWKKEKVLLLLSMKSCLSQNLNLVGRDLTPRQSDSFNYLLSNIAVLWIIKCWVELDSEPFIDIKIALIRLFHHVYHSFGDFYQILLFFYCIISPGTSVASGEDWKDWGSLMLEMFFRIMMVMMKLRLLRYALEWLSKKIYLFVATNSHFLDIMIIVLSRVTKCWVSQSHRQTFIVLLFLKLRFLGKFILFLFFKILINVQLLFLFLPEIFQLLSFLNKSIHSFLKWLHFTSFWKNHLFLKSGLEYFFIKNFCGWDFWFC